jgi:hypothetical protein
MTAVLCGVNRRQFAGQRGVQAGVGIGKGKLLFYGWPGLAVRQQLAFLIHVRWLSCLAQGLPPSASGKPAC